jgi:D-glycero-alpha-D-manno-heptose-7-phosphate kinase
MGSEHLTPDMIVTRTPLRVSFVGGGTDLPAFYEKEDGVVFSTAISRYVYVTVKRHSELFFEPIRLNYSKSEEVDRVDEIENDIARECLRFLGIDPPIYISTVGDVPASTGLGGSSTFCVGLLNALHAFKAERVSAGQLAEEACLIEIGVLGHPIGKQDQYAAAFGGFNVFCFRGDGGVTVEHQRFSDELRRRIFGSMMMFWTGHQRSTDDVLAEQEKNTDAEFGRLRKMRDQARELQLLLGSGRLDVETLGRVLDEGWSMKRELASGITNGEIDELYEAGIEAGAYGGKLCGAGGGGFLLFIVPTEGQTSVRRAMGHLPELRVQHEAQGTHVVVPFNR